MPAPILAFVNFWQHEEIAIVWSPLRRLPLSLLLISTYFNPIARWLIERIVNELFDLLSQVELDVNLLFLDLPLDLSKCLFEVPPALINDLSIFIQILFLHLAHPQLGRAHVNAAPLSGLGINPLQAPYSPILLRLFRLHHVNLVLCFFSETCCLFGDVTGDHCLRGSLHEGVIFEVVVWNFTTLELHKLLVEAQRLWEDGWTFCHKDNILF